MKLTLEDLVKGLPSKKLPKARAPSANLPHAPKRKVPLTRLERQTAIRNALRYFPPEHHKLLSNEFAQELDNYGHIYMYRFLPNIEMKAYPIQHYPAECQQAAAIMLMIMNNLDHDVAQFPEELVTYGGNGQVFSNWAQFWLVMNYLSVMHDDQTLVLYSGHPMGLYPSHRDAPRVVITNGMMVPNYSSKFLYDKFFSMGVTMYGQMTAGSYSYIGPQGIVHGTTITILNAGRKYLKANDLSGKVFVTSGLGGMSGAQAKAAVISGCVGVIAEVDEAALKKRYDQGWLMKVTSDLDTCLDEIRKAKKAGHPLSLGYHGNIVDLWEYLVHHYEKLGELLVDLGSDQTSCHNPFNGGYYPVQLSFEEANKVMVEYPERFKDLVQESLKRQISAINVLAKAGMHFWDYGNAFLLECHRAGALVTVPDDPTGTKFIYPSYVQDIMGDVFSMGFGPFRWVCCSRSDKDLQTTDEIALQVLTSLSKEDVPNEVRLQYSDNIRWIQNARGHNLVVGSQARILYSDQPGRLRIALEFNKAVASGRLTGPVVISRDHHDVSGTDSPFRETSNIYDGSAFTADMAVQNFVGDAFRGATWVSLHNGGGVGWGEVTNGGFGLVLDGSDDASRRATLMLGWDVWNGISRRSWAGNHLAKAAIQRGMACESRLLVTLPYDVEDQSIFNDL